MDIQTKAVHGFQKKDADYRPVVSPIYSSASFCFESIQKKPLYDYSRLNNPTRQDLEENIAALESGHCAIATGSGMAAITTVLFLCRPKDHVIANRDLYSGTRFLFQDVFTKMGIEYSFVDCRESEQVKQAIRPNTKMIWMETPSNPLLHVLDIPETVALAKENNILTVVDNTFLSPYFQRPFEFGADLVVHSSTKYLNGHQDIIGGVIVLREKQWEKSLKSLAVNLGVTQSPYEAWLTHRGLKTLGPRMEMHQRNGLHISNFLKNQPLVKNIRYPGLNTHPQFELIKKQMKGFGGVITFDLETEKLPLEKFFSRLKIFKLAESLGGVQSLIEAPYYMSHSCLGEEHLKKTEIKPQTVRIAAGIETPKDLIEDLKNALEV